MVFRMGHQPQNIALWIGKPRDIIHRAIGIIGIGRGPALGIAIAQGNQVMGV